jgi:hypothetical protein
MYDMKAADSVHFVVQVAPKSTNEAEMCMCAGLGCTVVLLYLCSERVAAGVTIELITFRILLFFSLFVLLFHCYAGLLFVIKA